MPSRERKEEYFETMKELIANNKKVLVVGADHVGSYQMQKIRMALRGTAQVLMGKNTMMRKVISIFVKENPGHPIENLVPCVQGNIGLIFTNGDLTAVRDVVKENTVPAAAKAGVLAECNVVVPPGPTGCDPGQTSWFQALNVPTKISRGQIEIVSELLLVSKGEKVGGSEAALLQKLNIRPFTYGLSLVSIYDEGSIFAAAVLDITDEILKTKFVEATRRLVAISLATGYPTLASLPHSVGNAMKRLIALGGEIQYAFPDMNEWQPLLITAAPAEAAAEE